MTKVNHKDGEVCAELLVSASEHGQTPKQRHAPEMESYREFIKPIVWVSIAHPRTDVTSLTCGNSASSTSAIQFYIYRIIQLPSLNTSSTNCVHARDSKQHSPLSPLLTANETSII